MRIIPARAGFTATFTLTAATPSDHPRSRGVYRRSAVRTMRGCGSSPLARGLPFSISTPFPPSRIIPARAGFTKPGNHGLGIDRDHPRSRGVYVNSAGTSTSSPGSSPLARGLHHDRVARPVVPGIIPARAGFT